MRTSRHLKLFSAALFCSPFLQPSAPAGGFRRSPRRWRIVLQLFSSARDSGAFLFSYFFEHGLMWSMRRLRRIYMCGFSKRQGEGDMYGVRHAGTGNRERRGDIHKHQLDKAVCSLSSNNLVRNLETWWKRTALLCWELPISMFACETLLSAVSYHWDTRWASQTCRGSRAEKRPRSSRSSFQRSARCAGG